MKSFQNTLLADLSPKGEPSRGTLAYLEARTQSDWHNFVVGLFLEEERAGRLTRADLARRTKKSPAVISRLLGRPGNWTLATLSNLLVGITSAESVPTARPIVRASDSNRELPDWAGQLALGNEAPPPPANLGLGAALKDSPGLGVHQ